MHLSPQMSCCFPFLSLPISHPQIPLTKAVQRGCDTAQLPRAAERCSSPRWLSVLATELCSLRINPTGALLLVSLVAQQGFCGSR